MRLHPNAKTTPVSRSLLVRRVLHRRWSVSETAHAFGVSPRTVYKWLQRYRTEASVDSGIGRVGRTASPTGRLQLGSGPSNPCAAVNGCLADRRAAPDGPLESRGRAPDQRLSSGAERIRRQRRARCAPSHLIWSSALRIRGSSVKKRSILQAPAQTGFDYFNSRFPPALFKKQ